KEEGRFRTAHQDARKLVSERDGLKQALAYLEGLQEQDISQAALEIAQAESGTAQANHKAAEGAVEKAVKAVDYRQTLIYMDGRVMNAEAAAQYKAAWSACNDAVAQLRQSVQEQAFRAKVADSLSDL